MPKRTDANLATERFAVLDGIRGLAAILVILDHFPSPMNTVVMSRALAVDFFFVLSGFVLAHAYSQRLDSGMSAFDFMRRRIIRLYPMYILGSLLGAIMAAVAVSQGQFAMTPQGFGLVSLFAVGFVPTPQHLGGSWGFYSFDHPAWSLAYELVANLAFAALAFMRRPKWIVWWLPIAAASLAYQSFQNQSTDLGWQYHAIDGGLVRIGYEFFLGLVIYSIWKKGYAFTIPAWIALPLLPAMACVGSLLQTENQRIALDVAFQIVVIPIIVAGAANARVSGVTERICSALGTLSFGVYMLHVPLGTLQGQFWRDAPATSPERIPQVLAIIAITLIAAAVTYVIYDKPARAWLMRVTARRRKVPVATTSRA
jgi:peptidoglycan/LPS O-acetylase OafA/YrhL